jgi:dTMP kinase
MRASFITFEGLDGSGKSTHLARAADWLEAAGIACQATKEPGGTPLGEALRTVFLDPRWGALDGAVESLVIFASRRQHLLEVIEPALAAGSHVLCDRFTDSTVAYQGHGRGLPLELIGRIDAIATGGRTPDHTLLFDLPAEEAHRRGQSTTREVVDRLDAEDLAFYRRVRQGYAELVRAEPGRFTTIDSSGPAERTWRRVRQVLAELLELPA